MLPGLLTAADLPGVSPDADRLTAVAGLGEVGLDPPAGGQHRLLLLRSAVDGDEHDVGRGDPGREHEAVVVGVGHDHRADQPRGDPPRGRPAVLLGAGRTGELDLLGVGEVLPEEVRRAGLECLAVLHHRLNRVGVDGPGKALRGGLGAADHRHGEIAFGEGGVDVEHPQRLLDRLGARRMRGMPLLPEKFGGAEEDAWAHLPADDVGPLVDQQRQIPPRLHPAGEHRPDDRFACRPDDEGLLELAGRDQLPLRREFEAVVRDDGAFLGEAFDMLRLLLEIRQRDEEREVGVLVTGLLEHPVEDRLHPLPHRVAERLDDHASADRRLLGEIGRLDDLLIPLRVVLGAGGGDCVVGHGGLRAGLSKGNG